MDKITLRPICWTEPENEPAAYCGNVMIGGVVKHGSKYQWLFLLHGVVLDRGTTWRKRAAKRKVERAFRAWLSRLFATE